MASKKHPWRVIGFVLLGLALMASSSLVGWIRDQRRAARQEFPASWKVDEILAALAKTGNPGPHSSVDPKPKAHVLTWKIEEDDRPWYVERCILWVHYADNTGRKHWTLAHVARNPKPPPRDGEGVWQLAMVYDAPFPYYRVFDYAPTNQDVYNFLRATRYEFGPSDGFKILDVGVCLETWREIIGEDPTKFFGS